MRRRRAALLIAAVAALLIVAALAALPAVVRALTVRQIEQLTGRETWIADVDVNLFTRHLVLRDVRIAGAGHRPPVAEIARLDVRFGLGALVRGRIDLASVDVEAPVIRLRRDERGELNIEDIVARLLARPPAARRPVMVDHFTMSGGRIVFDDAEADPTHVWEAGSLALEMHDVGTHHEGGRARLTFTVAGGRAGVELTEIAVRPLSARFVAAVAGLDVDRVRRYIPPDAAVVVTGGELTSRAEGRYHARDGATASGRTTVTNAVLVRGADDAPFLRVPQATMTARALTWRDGVGHAERLELRMSATVVDARAGPHGLDIAPVHLVLDDARYPRGPAARLTFSAGLPDDGQVAARGTAILHPFAADLAVTVARANLSLVRAWLPGDAVVTLDGGRLAASLDVDADETALTARGDFTVVDLALGRRGQSPPLVRDRRLTGTLAKVTVRDGEVAAGTITLAGAPTIVDATGDTAQRFELRQLTARVTGAAWPVRGPAQIAVDAALADGGTASVSGAIRPDTLAGQVEARVADVDLTRFTPYFPRNAPLALAGGRASARVELTHARETGVAIDGTATVADLVLVRRGQGDAFLTDPSLDVAVTGLSIKDGAVRVARSIVTGAPRVMVPAEWTREPFDFSALRVVVEDGAWPGPATARIEASGTVAGGGSSTLRGSIEIPTLAARAHATFSDIDLTRLNAYLPPDSAVTVAGRVDTTVDFAHDRATGVVVNGAGVASDIALRRRGEPDPFLTDQRLTFAVKDFVAKDDVLAVARVTATGSPAVIDRSVSPPRRISVPSMTAVAEEVQWPGDEPARLHLEAKLPESGALAADARVQLRSRVVDGTVSLRDAAVEPIARLLPIPAPVRGRADAELALDGTLGPDPEIHLRGTMRARRLEVGPDDRPPVTVAEADASGVDIRLGGPDMAPQTPPRSDRPDEAGPVLDDAGHGVHTAWPAAVTVDRLVLHEPSMLIVREDDGSFPLRRMLTPDGAQPADRGRGGDDDARPEAERAASHDAPAGDDRDVAVTIGRLEIDHGDVRFIDRSSRPFFSEEVTQLRMTVERLTNLDDARADVTLHGIVGADAALALEGEIAPFGDPFFLDLAGQLRGFDVPRTNPYLERFIAWIATSGRLTTRVHYRVVGDRLEATNEVVVERLSVEPASDSPDRLVGLPLGLVVSLLKDRRGEIHLSVPLEGRFSSPQWDFGDAIGTALRNVVTRLVTGPFRAIGKIFRRGADGEEISVAIDPVTFEPGSAALSPAGAKQVQRVADFLRASPHVRIALSAAVSDKDRRALRAQRITARVQAIQRERGIDEFGKAARALYEHEFPGQSAPPEPDDAMAVLANALPRPDPGIKGLAARRVTTAREALIEAAGIDTGRIVARDAPATITADEGRVEFELLPER
ncbi:MAG: DUF748 domain-containing protein [Candidatus Rokubacteria bacterium]|nr:DUF748 domain-containing protein [Candidatus Rokubacteria bacterium]